MENEEQEAKWEYKINQEPRGLKNKNWDKEWRLNIEK